MDKKGDRMSRKTVLLLGLVVFAFSMIGCNTIYRASKGAYDGAASGIKADLNSTVGADEWMRKNLW
jgi:hypothetical protein